MKIEFFVENRKLWRIFICAIIFNFQFSIFNSPKAQIAGLNTLTVLDLSANARNAGLGFDYLSLFDNDATVGLDNPSLLRHEMGRTASVGLVPLFDGSRMGFLSYVHDLGRAGTLMAGLRFHSYGNFEGYDEEERALGSFSAADYALTVGWGMWLDSNFSVGATFKPVLSQYDSYSAVAAAFDLTASYVSDNRRFAATVAARNIGAQLSTFDGTRETLPFELSAECSYKLQRAPFRFFFGVSELQKWNLRYEDPLHPTSEVDPFTGQVTREGWLEGTVDNILRHLQVGVELNLGKALFGRIGYSYRQTQEMRGIDVVNFSGFSFGIGLHTKRFEFSFARRNYHLGQAPNFLTLSYRF